MRHHHLARIATASALALTLLSGCSTWHSVSSYIRSDKAAKCPDVVILANTSVLPAFDPADGDDPTALIYRVRMTDVSTRCVYSKRRHTADTRVVVSYEATRAPGGAAVKYRVPYFVAVTNEGNIQQKQIHWIDLEFDQGATSTSGSVAVDSMTIKVAKNKKAYEYHLIAGFQLTRAQMAYNKKMGQYAP